MKKNIFTLLALIILASTNAQTTWKVDGAHSSVNFSVSHFMISEVTGNFGNFDMTATSNDKFEKPVFQVTIDAATINTNNEGRDKHLKSPDFFNVEKNPKIVFKSTSYKQLEDSNFSTTGDITINGKTEVITFTGKLNGIIKNSKSGKQKAGLKLSTTIKRENFNLGNGMSPIGKDVVVTVNLEMNEQ